MNMKAGHTISQIRQISNRIFDRMEAAGLVQRISDPDDRRKTLLSLTEKTRQLQPDYISVSREMNGIFYKGFSEDEICLCEAMLSRIHENLKQYDQTFQNKRKGEVQ